MKVFAGEKIVELDYDKSAILTLSSTEFLKRSFCAIDCTVALLIYDVAAPDVSNIKYKLTQFYGENATIFVDNKELLLKNLHMGSSNNACGTNIEYSTNVHSGKYIFIKGSPFIQRQRYSFADLLEVIRRLRDDDGCPWDREQTHSSIRGNTIEEAYELVEAVDLQDTAKMLEESGDVILQGLFHGAIAEDCGEFSQLDIINALCKKLVDRHTHIFGINKANNADEALKFWEQAKAIEKGQRSAVDKIKCVPTTFSALMQANKVQKICKKTGFDFANLQEAYDKLAEEIAELQAAPEAERENEAGDVLFSVVNIARMYNLDPELALNSSTNKFIRRFSYIEAQAKKYGKTLSECDMNTMDKWYREYKALYENR